MSTVYLILLSPVIVVALLFGLSRLTPRLRFLRTLAEVLIASLLCFFIIVSSLISLYRSLPHPELEDMQWGVSFAPAMSENLGQDWHAAYTAVLTELNPNVVRIPVFWNQVEAQRDYYYFNDLDWQLDQAALHKVPIMLAIGQKAPRWPECHYPTWLDQYNREQEQQELAQFIDQIVTRYRNHPALQSWQVENEPYLKFASFVGCPRITAAEVAAEISQVRTLDPNHPIITTDSGEAGGWITSLRQGDAFGTTMYRHVYDENFGKVTTYPYPPEYYPIKRDLIQLISGTRGKSIFVAELQAEPWGPKSITDMTIAEQEFYFSLDRLEENLRFAQKARLDSPTILWGAEWWYEMKENGVPKYWERMQELMNPSSAL